MKGLLYQKITVSTHLRESKTVSESEFHTVDSGFLVLDSGFCQWNLDSGFQSLVGFWNPQAVVQIPKPRIPDSNQRFPGFSYMGRKIAGNCPYSQRDASLVKENTLIYSYYYLHSMVGRTLRCQHLFSFLMSKAEPNKKVMRIKISIPFIYLQHSPHCMHDRELKQRRPRQRERQETIGLR